MPAKTLRLEDQLCFALYAATNAVTRAYRPRLDQIGLTYPQYLVLLVLWQHGRSTLGGIADRLRMSPNAVTPLIDRLEAAGLLERERDTADRRVVQIDLTAKGRMLQDSAAQSQQEVACETGLDDEAVAALREELLSLVRRMEPDRFGGPQDGRGEPQGQRRKAGP